MTQQKKKPRLMDGQPRDSHPAEDSLPAFDGPEDAKPYIVASGKTNLKTGSYFKSWKIGNPIGEGMCGVVYAAESKKLEKVKLFL
jgi:hypothetical protein